MVGTQRDRHNALMTRRVLLHVGTPKSGTSYLQDRLALNRERLAAQGLEYVGTRTGDHFEAALDLIGERWAGEEQVARGQWDALVTESRRARGDILVSHEILAAAGPDQAARALASFPDHEPHVVLTARDLGRQVPAEWQERVKHRGQISYVDFLKALHRNHSREERPSWFWRVQHLPRILETWGRGLPPERVHLVTVPPPGSPSGLLWERYTRVLGMADPLALEDSTTTNASLGGPEVTMLRELNVALAERGVPRPVYVEWVREAIVREVLAERPSMRPATVPPRRRAWVEAISQEWRDAIEASGVDVVGDLDDLAPVWPVERRWPNPDLADRAAVADAAIESLAHVLAAIEPEAPRITSRVSRLTRRLQG